MEANYQTVYYWDDDERSLAPFRFRDISNHDDDIYVPIVPIIQRYWKERQEELYSYVGYKNSNTYIEGGRVCDNGFNNMLFTTDKYICEYDMYYDEDFIEDGYIYEEDSEKSEDDDKTVTIIDDMVYKKFSYF